MRNQETWKRETIAEIVKKLGKRLNLVRIAAEQWEENDRRRFCSDKIVKEQQGTGDDSLLYVEGYYPGGMFAFNRNLTLGE